MKMQLWTWCVVLMAFAASNANVLSPVAAEEVSYNFDFEVPEFPEALESLPTSTRDDFSNPAYEISNGVLRVFDMVSATGGLNFSPNAFDPDRFLTDTYVSAVVNADGGLMGGVHSLNARFTTLPGDDMDGYSCTLWPDPDNAARVQLLVYKFVDNKLAGMSQSDYFDVPITEPCLLEFDVVDGETSGGLQYTELTGRVTYDNGQRTTSVSRVDWGTPGGHARLTSGWASVTTGLFQQHRDAGWVLDDAFDDLTIRGTLVPEPSVMLLAAVGAAAVAWWRRPR